MTWQILDSSMRCSSFKNSIWARRRQRRFRLVENEDALPLAAFLEEPQKALAVGMREEVRRRLACITCRTVEISCDGEETLGPEEPTVGDLGQPARAQRRRQLAAHGLDRFRVIHRLVALAAASFVISGQHGDALEQGRFAHTVLADDDGDRAVEAQLELALQERQAKRIGRGILDPIRLQPDPPQVGCGHVDRALA